MTFFLRNISISALVLAVLIGSVAVYFSSRAVYEMMLNQIFKERVLLMETLGELGLPEQPVVPLVTHESATTTVVKMGAPHLLQERIFQIGNTQPGVRSLVLINSATKEVLASAVPAEVGTVVTIPSEVRTGEGAVVPSLSRNPEERVVYLSYLSLNGELLLMTVEQSFFINPAIVTGVLQAVLLIGAFGAFALVFYAIIRRFFMRPVRQLKRVLENVEQNKETGEEDTEKERRPRHEGFGELLESFSTVARQIESTIEHDKVVAQTKSDFISTTAHQLRTPLSGINWALGSLKTGENLTDEQKALLDRAMEKTKELVAIVGELLSAAGIEQGKFGFHREELSLKEQIEQTIAEEKDLAEKNNVTLKFEFEERDYPSVYADKERIRWVIRNLIENAIRYTKEGGSVAVHLRREKKQLLVSVKDNGIGITPEAQQHIFERFYRSPEAKRKRNDGSGLGLFIVKNIVNYHGGRIWFESVEGVGTTFFFTLPVIEGVAQSAKA